MLLHCQICIFISGHSKFAMDWNLFFFCKITFTLNCWLLCLSGCEIYNVQYCKSKNIGNTRKIKEKLKILMTCDDFYFVNTTQKTSKPFKKKCVQFPGWMRKNFIRRNVSWRVLAETWDASYFKKGLLEKQQCSNTCNISSLKNIFFQNLTEPFLKYLWLYWYYTILIFTSKLPDPTTNKITLPPTI